jgi:hypothetical protein
MRDDVCMQKLSGRDIQFKPVRLPGLLEAMGKGVTIKGPDGRGVTS